MGLDPFVKKLVWNLNNQFLFWECDRLDRLEPGIYGVLRRSPRLVLIFSHVLSGMFTKYYPQVIHIVNFIWIYKKTYILFNDQIINSGYFLFPFLFCLFETLFVSFPAFSWRMIWKERTNLAIASVRTNTVFVLEWKPSAVGLFSGGGAKKAVIVFQHNLP